jgi:hypothetical protein
MAMVFLCAFVIVSVSHHVFAATFWAGMRYNRLYHEKVLPVNLVVCLRVPFHTSSVKISPLPKRVHVRCSPAARIYLTGRSYRASSAHGPGITEAELSLEDMDTPYCRVTVRDTNGGRAWSNPIWLD